MKAKKLYPLIFIIFGILISCYSVFLGVVDVPLDEKWIQKDIVYQSGPKIDKKKQSLDFYIPPNRFNFPVLIFVHGGAWSSGDKREYKYLGKFFAFNGIGTAVINYRLSPKVKHPAHIEDVATAFSWIYKNVKSLGGDPNKIFIMGHSAGAHLSALLALDKRYLNAHGLSPSLIQGTIVLDGIYDLTLGGKKETWLSKAFFKRVFGDNPENKKYASPIIYISENCPPFLIIQAKNDHLVPIHQPLRFYESLKEKGLEAEFVLVPRKNHITIMTSIGKSNDYTTEIIFSFIKKYS